MLMLYQQLNMCVCEEKLMGKQYTSILIVVLFIALYKCKRNGGRGQTTSGVNAGDDDNGDTSSGQIAMGPTSLPVNATMAW